MGLAETALAYGFRNRLDPVAGFENVKSDAFQSTLGVIPANQATLDARAANEALSQQATLVNNAAVREQRREEFEQANDPNSKWNRAARGFERKNALLRSLSYLGQGQGALQAEVPRAPTLREMYDEQLARLQYENAVRGSLGDATAQSRGSAGAAIIRGQQGV